MRVTPKRAERAFFSSNWGVADQVSQSILPLRDVSLLHRPVPMLPQTALEEQVIQTKRQYLGVLNGAIAQVRAMRAIILCLV